LGPWIHRITTNLFLDKVRRERRIRFQAFAADAGDRLPSREPTPGQLLEIQTINDDVQAALNVLSPGVRAAVVLRDVEGHTHAEIAMALGIKISTVRARLACGRRRLCNALANHAVRGAAQACVSGIEGRTE
jgi:RNA polymerase sigma-70 factor (ECF subfamily)